MQTNKPILKEEISGDVLTLTIFWRHDLVIKTILTWRNTSLQPTFHSTYSEHLRDLLLDYEKGNAVLWNYVPLDWTVIPQTSFKKNVLSILSTINYGTILTYGKLAELAGNPHAARAVGNIMSKNPWPLILPCHRVVARNRHLTGFKGSGGLSMKAWLLEREGHTIYNGIKLSTINYMDTTGSSI